MTTKEKKEQEGVVRENNAKVRRQKRDARKEARKQHGIAVAKFVKTPPRKIRLVADMIRGKSVFDASCILEFTNKRAAKTLAKVLRSAVYNAAGNGLDGDNLYVSTVYVDQGPAFKRWLPRARGRATVVKKYTSHITVHVSEREDA